MSDESEEIKKLMSFKKRLEKRIEELQSELKELQESLEVINSILLSRGFKRAEIVKTPSTTELLTPKMEAAVPPAEEFKEIIPLNTVTGENLAKIYVGEKSLKVVLDKSKNFNVNTPPFNQFLIERVLAKMQEKDSELAKAGKLKPEEIFSYNIVREGDFVREIHVRNFDAERLKELKSSLRWTLEKMYEKMKT
ncbi:MAG: hypothetical protein RMJ15_05530 [Nitrososphaerota archaeon]|nr:hypothetical protein [Nitrososphaerota archaeon]